MWPSLSFLSVTERPSLDRETAAGILARGLLAGNEWRGLRQGLSIVGYGEREAVSITSGLRRGRLSPPVSGQGAEFYEMSGVDLVCINLVESNTFGARKFLKKPAAPAALAALKARQEAVQLWGCGSLAILNLPRICRTCHICPRSAPDWVR